MKTKTRGSKAKGAPKSAPPADEPPSHFNLIVKQPAAGWDCRADIRLMAADGFAALRKLLSCDEPADGETRGAFELTETDVRFEITPAIDEMLAKHDVSLKEIGSRFSNNRLSYLTRVFSVLRSAAKQDAGDAASAALLARAADFASVADVDAERADKEDELRQRSAQQHTEHVQALKKEVAHLQQQVVSECSAGRGAHSAAHTPHARVSAIVAR